MDHFALSSWLLGTEEYPYLLSQTKTPPRQLFGQGRSDVLNLPAVSIIGSRKMSDYGARVVRELVPQLVQAGLVIVSGLAYGVDSYVHEVALQWKGKCLAVLGSGLDMVYPRSNIGLFRSILREGGLVLSEYPLGTPPQHYHFPQRNRIVAGLGKVVVIIEAGEKSGTLITARYAVEAGREVCVVPGDIFRPTSVGAISLLRQGAQPITCAQDILDLYSLEARTIVPQTLRPALTGSMAALYDLISHEGIQAEVLLQEAGVSAAQLQSILSVLELDGYIQCKENKWHKT